MQNPNEPAFPVVAENGLGHISSGMTLRDYFAGQALSGILACIREFDGHEKISGRVKMAYRHADAMLKAREEVK